MPSRARCSSCCAGRDLSAHSARIHRVNRREFLAATAAVVAAPRSALAAAGSTLVLVTADLQSRVLAIEAESGAVRKTISTHGYPRSIEAVGSFAVVAHPELGAVSILDTRALRVTHVLRGFAEPRYTAAHPDGRHAFVTDAARGELVTLDLVRGRVSTRVAVGRRARHVTIDPRGTRVWVALGSKAEEVAVVDVRVPARPRLVERFRPPFLAHDVACTPDGRHLWVSSGDRFELAVYDLRRGRVLSRPSGDWPPQHVSFARHTAYVTSGWSGTLRLHRPDGRPLREVPVPVGSYNVQHGLGRVVTPSLRDGTVTILDEDGRVVESRSVATSSHDACLV
jgi:DNA-binding beta-propeller fold protein YncE